MTEESYRAAVKLLGASSAYSEVCDQCGVSGSFLPPAPEGAAHTQIRLTLAGSFLCGECLTKNSRGYE